MYICNFALVPPLGNDPSQPEGSGFTDRATSLVAYEGMINLVPNQGIKPRQCLITSEVQSHSAQFGVIFVHQCMMLLLLLQEIQF